MTMVSAMFRFVVLLFSVVWASLLLLSWSSADPPSAAPITPQTSQASTR